MNYINVAEYFGYATEKLNGEEFKDLITSFLNKNEYVEINLDNFYYPYDFLQEAFGNLVKLGFGKQFIFEHLVFKTNNQELKTSINKIIENEVLIITK